MNYLIGTILARISLLGCLLAFTGCSSLGYLAHTASGHLELMSKRQPIASVVQQPETDLKTRASLLNAQDIRDYASSALSLPDNASYTHYVELDRDYVTWVVFAAPELSLQPVSWCFWIIGCVPYRGYFEQAKALEFGEQMSAKGMEIYISPVAAYSTLGWFSDPLLSSMLKRGEISTADIIFHELAHQQLYIKNDTEFNEAFATAVARAGVRDWLRSNRKIELLARYENSVVQKNQLYSQIQQLRLKLKEIYAASSTDDDKRVQKMLVIEEYRTTVDAIISKWEHGNRYRTWALEDMNNAKLNAISTYQELTSEFIALLKVCDNDYHKFYRVVESMQKLDKQQRRDYLRKLKCMQIGDANVAQ